MQEILRELTRSIDEQVDLAYCRLVETKGSTPQKAGAPMLVYANGEQCGTLGGGCVEAEVKRRAITAIQENASAVQTFFLDGDYGWDDGLICGGRLTVLIHPIVHKREAADSAETLTYFRELCEAAANGGAVTEAIVFDENRQPPAMMLFDVNRQLSAQLRADEAAIAETAAELRDLSQRPKAYVCGGVAFLPILSRCRLLIVGGGHVGKAVAELAVDLDFDVWVFDDRGDYVADDRFPGAQRRIHGPVEEVLPTIPIDADTYCLIVTRGHNHDEQALYHLADRGAAYVGMIGSRRKIRLIMDSLRSEGVREEALEKVYAPVGLDIGSQTVPEIALSICAEIVSHRNRCGVVVGRESGAGIHE